MKNTKKYEFKKGAFRNAPGLDAQEIGEALISIHDSEGELTPEAVIKAAKPKSSPMHRWFEWDNTKAASQHRLSQARKLIQIVRVRIIRGDEPEAEAEPIRAFVSMIDGDAKDRHYESILDVMVDQDKRDRLLRQAFKELTALQNRYDELSELAGVFAAVQKARKKATTKAA